MQRVPRPIAASRSTVSNTSRRRPCPASAPACSSRDAVVASVGAFLEFAGFTASSLTAAAAVPAPPAALLHRRPPPKQRRGTRQQCAPGSGGSGCSPRLPLVQRGARESKAASTSISGMAAVNLAALTATQLYPKSQELYEKLVLLLRRCLHQAVLP